MKEIPLKYKRIVYEKLACYGFEKSGGGYARTSPVLGGQFELKLYADGGGKLWSQLTDAASDEEYVLHLVPSAQGEFVGSVKAAYNSAINEFFENCCETDVFRSPSSRAAIEYARKTYGDELEFLWEKLPEAAVLRRKDTQSWYAVLLTVPRNKIGFGTGETAEIIDLRISPEKLAATLDGKKYLPAYHMNKKSWLTVVLDGSVPDGELCGRIDDSYKLACKKSKT